jgi:hypothetical protein
MIRQYSEHEEQTSMMTRPPDTEYAPYFSRYVSLVPESDVLAVLHDQLAGINRLSGMVSPEREKFRYAADKWSIREVAGHLIDAERVFGYRAFCISRGERALLPAFDENAYVAESHCDERPLNDLGLEFTLVRRGNLDFLSQMTDREWKRIGTASNNPVSVRALAYIMAGHVRHHFTILSTQYGMSSGF